MAIALAIPTAAPAAVFIWDGGGADNNWGTVANWTGSAPANDANTDLEFGTVALQSPFRTIANNTVSGFNVNSITFGNTAGSSFNLTGSNVEFKKDGASVNPSVVQNSSFTQTLNFSAAMIIGGDQLTLTGSGTGLVNIGAINTGGKPVIKDGTSSYVLTGALSGGNHNLTLNNGTLANATATNITSSTLQLRGGVYATSGTFNRSLGTSAGQFNWGTGGGGFAAYNGALLVDVGGAGSTSQTWGSANFIPAGSPLIFGSAIANNVVTYQDAINLGTSANNTREIRVNDNASSSTDWARISGNLSQTGGTQSLNKTGNGVLDLAGSNTYEGSTTVSAGTLLVSGTLSSIGGLVSVNSGATLGGTGTINRSVAVANSGILAPGAGTGTLTTGALTLNASSDLVFELDTPNVVVGGENDLVTVNGNLTLDGMLDVIAFVDGDAFTFGVGTYRLFNYTGTLNNQGLAFDSMPSGFNYAIDTGTTGQVNLTVSAVPEPTTLSLVGIAGAALLLRRRGATRV